MPMPKRPRFIESHPNVQGFTPEGITHTGDTILSMEEFETIRLSDHLRITVGCYEMQGRKRGHRRCDSKTIEQKEDIMIQEPKKNDQIYQANANEQDKKDNGRSKGKGQGRSRGQGGGRGRGQGSGKGRGQGLGRGKGDGSCKRDST